MSRSALDPCVHLTLYDVLIQRLESNAPTPASNNDQTTWCYCKRGDIGGTSVGCDVANREIQWYHMECLSAKYQSLAEKHDTWMCPNCYTRQVFDLLNEEEKKKTKETGDCILDETALALEALKIQDDDSKMQQDTQSSTYPTAPSICIFNFGSLRLSAALWTSIKTQTRIFKSDGSIYQIRYQHNANIPELPRDAQKLSLICPMSGRNPEVCVPVELLATFSFPIRDFVKEFGINALHSASIEVPAVDRDVVQTAMSFLRGYPLYIKLYRSPINEQAKRRLIQRCHLAHVLGIPILQNAAMHGLCATIIRQPDVWLDANNNTLLLDTTPFRGNPARRVLLDGPHCILPHRNAEKSLPSGDGLRDLLCINNGLRRLWSRGGVMGVIPAEVADDTTEPENNDATENVEQKPSPWRKKRVNELDVEDDEYQENAGNKRTRRQQRQR